MGLVLSICCAITGLNLLGDGNGFTRVGAIRQFEAIFTDLIPAMLDKGFTQSEIDQILIENPKNAFEFPVRKSTR